MVFEIWLVACKLSSDERQCICNRVVGLVGKPLCVHIFGEDTNKSIKKRFAVGNGWQCCFTCDANIVSIMLVSDVGHEISEIYHFRRAYNLSAAWIWMGHVGHVNGWTLSVRTDPYDRRWLSGRSRGIPNWISWVTVFPYPPILSGQLYQRDRVQLTNTPYWNWCRLSF